MCGASVGIFASTVTGSTGLERFLIVEICAVLVALFSRAYSNAAAKSLGRDPGAMAWLDCLSWLPALLFLFELYIVNFPIENSRRYFDVVLAGVVAFLVVSIKALTWVGLKYRAKIFLGAVVGGFVVALAASKLYDAPFWGYVFSAKFLLAWQALAATIYLGVRAVQYFVNAKASKAGMFIVAAIIVAGLGLKYLPERKPIAVSTNDIIAALPDAKPFRAFAGKKLLHKRVDIEGQKRDAAILKLGDSVEFTFSKPDGAKLKLGLAVPKADWERGCGPVDVTISAMAMNPMDRSTAELTIIRFDPAIRLQDRKWRDIVVDLDAVPGPAIYMSIVLTGDGKNACQHIALNEPRPMASLVSKPDIVVIVIDTLRKDRVGAYGYERPTTPNMDKLAKKAVVFENAVAQSSWTLPSTATIMTSLYPTEHGTIDLASPFLADELTTMAEALKDAGYETAAFSATPVISDDLGFGQGFDVFDESCYSHLDRDGAECLVNAATKWLETASSPYFVYLHFYDVHAPYNAPGYTRDMFYSGYKTDNRYLAMGEGYFFDKLFRLTGRHGLSAADLDYMNALYDGEIRYVDDQLGALLNKLAENVVVAITADHGEEFLDHGNFWHGHSLYSELVNVPLIFKAPGRVGRRSDVANLVDLAPTLLSLAGIEIPKLMRGVDLFDDRSIRRAAFTEVVYDNKAIYSLRIYDLKFIKTVGGVALFDVSGDPMEKRDMASSSPDLASEMNKALDDFLKSLKPLVAGGRTLGDEQAKRLRALGYLNNADNHK